MNYRTLFQISLILLALLLSTLFYFKYFYKTNLETLSEDLSLENKDISKSSKGNVIKNILYESYDENGNKYLIKSDYGTFKDEKKNEILMTNVTAQIKLKNGTNIDLTSKNARYNTLNNNTNFYDNVELNYLEHKVNSDNIDVFFNTSKLEAYSNLVYRNPELNLIDDKVEIDLLTQDSKISMFDNSQVKIIKNK